jgi:hypothetical protein
MANWIIRCSQDWLMPVVEQLRRKFLKRDIIHCDETPVQVLKEQGKKPQSKSYISISLTSHYIFHGHPNISFKLRHPDFKNYACLVNTSSLLKMIR